MYTAITSAQRARLNALHLVIDVHVSGMGREHEFELCGWDEFQTWHEAQGTSDYGDDVLDHATLVVYIDGDWAAEIHGNGSFRLEGLLEELEDWLKPPTLPAALASS